MASFKLTNAAVEDLSNIWEYTFEIWSEAQGDKYYNLLIAGCQKIAECRTWEKTIMAYRSNFSA